MVNDAVLASGDDAEDISIVFNQLRDEVGNEEYVVSCHSLL